VNATTCLVRRWPYLCFRCLPRLRRWPPDHHQDRCQRSLPPLLPPITSPSAPSARVISAYNSTLPLAMPAPTAGPPAASLQLLHHQNAEGHHLAVTALSGKMSGGVLLSHAVSRAVPSALKGLTSGFGMGPGISPSLWPPKLYGDVHRSDRISGTAQWTQTKSRSRAKPLGLLVPVSSTRCRASTSGLSTQSSSWGPYQVNPEGDLILRRASRLDAFSGYPFQT
jgi:hypothetical protein